MDLINQTKDKLTGLVLVKEVTENVVPLKFEDIFMKWGITFFKNVTEMQILEIELISLWVKFWVKHFARHNVNLYTSWSVNETQNVSRQIHWAK